MGGGVVAGRGSGCSVSMELGAAHAPAAAGSSRHCNPARTVAQRAGVNQLVRVDAGDGAAGDVAHIVHAALHSRRSGHSRAWSAHAP